MNINKKAKPVFIIGFPRCASSTLTSILNSHPSIIFPKNKGTNFFSTDEFVSGKQLFFNKYFEDWSDEEYFGDGNPVHSFLPYIPKRMFELFPDAKLIFSLRDPVIRAYSNWFHNRESGLENRSFNDVITEELNMLKSLDLNNDQYWLDYRKKMLGDENDWRSNTRYYLLRGYYALHIKRFLEYYPKDQIHILNFKDFKSDSHIEVIKILKFLGLEMVTQVNYKKHLNYAFKNDSILKLKHQISKYGFKKYIPKYIQKGLSNILSNIATKTKTKTKAKMKNDDRILIENYYRKKNIELDILLKGKFNL